MPDISSRANSGRRIATASILTSAGLAFAKILIGWLGGSTSVVADGLESAGDVVASTLVFFGLTIAARPADEHHPYGHGRAEMLTGLAVGLILLMGGAGICFRSLDKISETHAPPAVYTIWPLLASVVAKATLSTLKFRVGRRISSSALVADAWNDMIDILSAVAALTAVGLTLYDPSRFLLADHIGGFVVGLIVVITGIRVISETTSQLMDTMPEPEQMARIREVSLSVPGVLGVEKCFARKTGFQHHVDLHLEVDPDMTVRHSHQLAHEVQQRIRGELDWVADVLVHVEPAPAAAKTPAAPKGGSSDARGLAGCAGTAPSD